MDQFITFGIVGLSTAAIYAIIGSGLVLTYTTTGVFNFAHGGAGMLAAFMYWQLTKGWGMPVWLALVICLLVLAPLFGLLVELIVRPVARLGEAERLVVTVALLSGFIASARWIWNPNLPRSLDEFFRNTKAVHIGSATLTWHQIITMLVAVAVAIGLRILLFNTRTGAEMRATVDDRALAGMNGADPVRANKIAWILGTQLAALGGILIAPKVSMDAQQLALLIVSAYAAAVFGRMKSLPMTFFGAIVVGCTESYLQGYLPQNEYLPGLRLAAPAILLLLVLLLFPHNRLKGKGERLGKVPLPSMVGTMYFALGTIIFGVILATVLNEASLITYGPIFSLGIVALSYVPLAGFAGQISLCQLSFAGIGAVVWAHVGDSGQVWALLVVMAVSAVVGAIVALPALRLSGVYLALGTVAFAFILDRWIFTLPNFELFGINFAFFEQGSVEVVGPDIFGYQPDSSKEMMILAAIVLGLATIGIAALRRSRFGRRLIASRDSEAAYATLGGNLLISRVLVFAFSAGIAGLGGAVYGMQQRSVTPEQFNLVAGLPLFLIAVVAGLGSVGTGFASGFMLTGPIFAMQSLAHWTHNLAALLPGLAGVGMGSNPDGVNTHFRNDWTPLLRSPIALPGALVTIAAGWLLKLNDVINGWTFLFGALVICMILQRWALNRANAAAAAPKSPEDLIPVEWWGIKRPFREEDKEVLARGIAGS
ncbi:ABC transporter permease [Yinghuangia sp. ASG 101]|uniref:branched-chain amino acid ABC transporter permease n=1 Tax=Yinghuangia sp. ASG 101 TaxID=2896848 RepID=UPI001E31A17C|nr:ABC transporter permease [Yinghuangia sp. ASG 101]UGQ13200.1 ABC transporter permease [Yinghuangia sp. ASG 101]